MKNKYIEKWHLQGCIRLVGAIISSGIKHKDIDFLKSEYCNSLLDFISEYYDKDNNTGVTKRGLHGDLLKQIKELCDEDSSAGC